MPFVEVNIKNIIEEEKKSDPEFKKTWDESRTEYRLLGEIIKLRKSKGLTQSDLAVRTGNKQQVISRIETKESSPTLKTVCSIMDALNYDIKFVPRENDTVAI